MLIDFYSSRGPQVFCGVYFKGLSGSDRSNITWEFWEIWPSRWQAGNASLFSCEMRCDFFLPFIYIWKWSSFKTTCDNFLKQGFQMGIALPQFLLDIDGASGGILLLWIVGVCILLPLVIAVVYLSRSSKYTGNYVMHQTLSAYYFYMKPSLAPRYMCKYHCLIGSNCGYC